MPNRFYDTPGNLSRQLSPWELTNRGFVNRRRAIFLLQEEIRFSSDIANDDIVVPVGFMSDLASIPKVAWGIFMAPDDPRVELGGWVHDLLYCTVGQYKPGIIPLTRKQCDQILAFEAMSELGANKFQQRMVYHALRLGGRGSFNTNPPTIRWKFVHITGNLRGIGR
jgi:hypothetical protein